MIDASAESVRRTCISLAMILHTGIEFFWDMPLTELEEWASDVNYVLGEVEKELT